MNNHEFHEYRAKLLSEGSHGPLAAKLTDRIRGSLLAGAAGDALGYTVEFMDIRRIRKEFGAAGISSYVLCQGKARISDDTQMTLFTAAGLLEASIPDGQKADPVSLIYRAYLAWLQTQGYTVDIDTTPCLFLLNEPELHARRAPGNTCLSALLSGSMGTLQQPVNNSKGCGGVMRTAPAGMLPVFSESPLVIGAKAGAVTHGHPMGYIPAGMLADLIYRILYTDCRSLADAVTQSLEAVRNTFGLCPDLEAYEALICRAMELSQKNLNDVDAIHSLGGGWVGDEALAIAIYCALKYSQDLDACLRAAVNHSGDADSTGSIAGNILGAHLGLSALPSRYLDNLELRHLIEAVADRVTTAAIQNGNPD